MKGLLGLVQAYLFDLALEKTKEALIPAGKILRRFTIGAVVIMVSSIAWTASLIFLMMSLFFSLSPYGTLAGPALWTGLGAVAVGVILVLIGLTLLRKPR